MSTSRRSWIRQTSLTIAALGIGKALTAAPSLCEENPTGRVILLNSNENPFGPAPSVVKVMSSTAVKSNRYSDDEVKDLIKKLATFQGVAPENLIMSAGSSEILGQSTLMAAQKGGNVITAEPSFNPWTRLAKEFGLKVISVPVDKDYKLDLDKMRAAIDAETRLIYVCNPNNPVGNYIEFEKLKAFVEECSTKCMVLVDEAYTEFAELPSMASIAIKNKNIIVAKTFSKIYGLAGARIGYAIAHPETIKRFESLQSWANGQVGQVNVAAASAALDDQAFVVACRDKTKECRQFCYDTFKKLNLKYIPSVTSFMMFNIDTIKCDYQATMEKENIMVQYRNHFGGKWCRVSMGTMEEMKAFGKVLETMC
jgi:histidinol-phosphate aminotransferase